MSPDETITENPELYPDTWDPFPKRRAKRRKNDFKNALRQKRIAEEYLGRGLYSNLHQYSKNKAQRPNRRPRSQDNHGKHSLTLAEKRRLDSMAEQAEEMDQVGAIWIEEEEAEFRLARQAMQIEDDEDREKFLMENMEGFEGWKWRFFLEREFAWLDTKEDYWDEFLSKDSENDDSENEA